MKFALVDGERQEARPNLQGTCPACSQQTIAKCGEIRAPHWAHRGRRFCDPWWENETEWHRAWKEQFPAAWQEIVHIADDGAKHIADVKTDHGWTIDFQHSYLKPEERRSRDAFYRQLVWVVNGMRRKTDAAQFNRALGASMPVGGSQWPRRVLVEACGLLREWQGSSSAIFFDFGNDQVLWWVLAKRSNGLAYVAPISRIEFVRCYLDASTPEARDFLDFVKTADQLVARYESSFRHGS